MKIEVLHTAWCNISGEAAGEVWIWSLFGRFRTAGLLCGVGGLLAASIVVTASIIGAFDLNVALAGDIEGGWVQWMMK